VPCLVAMQCNKDAMVGLLRIEGSQVIAYVR
jgi:hypothetical protein